MNELDEEIAVLDLPGTSKGAKTAGARVLANARGGAGGGRMNRFNKARAAKIQAAGERAYKSGKIGLARGGGITKNARTAPTGAQKSAATRRMNRMAAKITAKRQAAKAKGRASRRPKK